MTNRIYKTDEEGNPVIHIIGKLDSTAVLGEFLANPQQHFRVIFDLKETELITEQCLELLKDYSEKCTVSFRNFSLYVELLLSENGFLNQQLNK
jgi:hypothetical protein